MGGESRAVRTGAEALSPASGRVRKIALTCLSQIFSISSAPAGVFCFVVLSCRSALSNFFIELLCAFTVLMGRGLPGTPRNKYLSTVFLPLYDGNEGPCRNPPSSPAAPATFTINGGHSAALQERGGRHADETQLQNVDRNAPRRRHAFSLRARSIQPGVHRNPDRRTAPAASDRSAPAMPRSGR